MLYYYSQLVIENGMNSNKNKYINRSILIMKKHIRFTAALLALGLCVSTAVSQIPVSATEETAADTSAQVQTADPSIVTTNGIAGWPQATDISSTAAVVMETSTNTVLYSKNSDQALYPASAVKIMTCLLALENSSLDDQVTMTATGVSGVTDGGVNISAQLDEVFTMEQCLYAIMVASANDIALQVAEHISGSVDAFVAAMNARAQELGCTNTVFTNPTGLPDDNQHTTAHDLALIMKAAISNDSFRTISGATSYTIPATNVSGGARNLTSSFSMTTPTSATYYQGCIGGRESTTTASGSVLVTAAERNSTTLICVVMNGATGQTANEAITLMDYGFANFQLLDLAEEDFHILSGGTVMVPAGATSDDLTTEDTPSDGQLLRTYSFGGAQVGTAVVEDTSEESTTTEVQENDDNMDAAKAYSESRSPIPYFVIGGVGVLLLLLLLWRMIKIIRA